MFDPLFGCHWEMETARTTTTTAQQLPQQLQQLQQQQQQTTTTTIITTTTTTSTATQQLQLQLQLQHTATTTTTTTTTTTPPYTTLHCTKRHYTNYNYNHNYNYATLHYTTLDFTTHTTLHYTRPITPLQCDCNCTTLVSLHHYATTTTTAAVHYTTSSSCGWGDHCNHCNHSNKHKSNQLSVNQWIRSAIRDSQQPTSPIGFLFWNFRRRLVRYYWYKLEARNPGRGVVNAQCLKHRFAWHITLKPEKKHWTNGWVLTSILLVSLFDVRISLGHIVFQA